MASSTASRKAKGRRLQQYVRDAILELFPELTLRDCRSTPMGVGGEDVLLSAKAAELFPYSVEAKNQEKLNIWASLVEAESNTRDLEPLLVFKRNSSKTYCVVEFEHFMELLHRIKTLDTPK